MKQKHLLSLRDFSREEIEEIFDLAERVKADPASHASALRGKSLAMI
ncbi:MAG TPA: ornithine carbamoyltransferase, partial [Vicinamibacteria bacterium]